MFKSTMQWNLWKLKHVFLEVEWKVFIIFIVLRIYKYIVSFVSNLICHQNDLFRLHIHINEFYKVPFMVMKLMILRWCLNHLRTVIELKESSVYGFRVSNKCIWCIINFTEKEFLMYRRTLHCITFRLINKIEFHSILCANYSLLWNFF